MVDAWQFAGKSTAGFISPGRFEHGEKTGIFAKNIMSQESRLLASNQAGEIPGLGFGIWHFDAEVIHWVNQTFGLISTTELLVVDEIGPVEFDLSQGWISAFEVIRIATYQLALVVIRPAYVAAFRKMGYSFKNLDLDQSGTNADRVKPFLPNNYG